MFNQEAYNKLKSEIPKEVKVLAATKAKSPADIKQAVNSGIKIIGENYVQEAKEKYDILKDFFRTNNVSFHLIGHLQSNKTKEAVEIFECIETIDSFKLAEKINEECKKINKKMQIFIEVNLGEQQKSGIEIDKLEELIAKIKGLENLTLLGLMIIPKIGNEEENYRKIKELSEKFNLKEISMGMSGDYSAAIANGSTLIRLGTILFGERD